MILFQLPAPALLSKNGSIVARDSAAENHLWIELRGLPSYFASSGWWRGSGGLGNKRRDLQL
jgi:hypothetical protein